MTSKRSAVIMFCKVCNMYEKNDEKLLKISKNSKNSKFWVDKFQCYLPLVLLWNPRRIWKRYEIISVGMKKAAFFLQCDMSWPLTDLISMLFQWSCFANWKNHLFSFTSLISSTALIEHFVTFDFVQCTSDRKQFDTKPIQSKI